LVAEKLNFGDETLRKKLLTDIDDQQKMLVGFFSRLKQS
jgi:hypothetical protein